VKQDYAAAARWTRRAAEHGAAGAQLAMAILYDQGRGVPKDPKAARQWAEKAAAQGFELADKFLAIPAWKFWERRGFFTGLH
jgi:TPR repeat protein